MKSILLAMALAVSGSASMIQLGFPRYSSRDSADWQAGMQIAINEANDKGLVPGYNFSLLLTNIPACNSSVASECKLQAAADAAEFLGNISSMGAIFTPDWWISDSVISATQSLKIPVISPKTFGQSSAEHVIYLNEAPSADASQLMAFMFASNQCARTGIIATQYLPSFDPLEVIQEAFLFGGYPSPPIVLTNVTDAEMLSFVFEEDSDRLCFMLQVTVDELKSLMTLLKSDNRFSTNKFAFFSFGEIDAPSYDLNGDSTMFDSLYLSRHAPSYNANTSTSRSYLSAFASWHSSETYAQDSSTYLSTDILPSKPSESGFLTYIATRYVIELIKIASAPYQQTGTMPSQSAILDVAYTSRIYVAGTIFQPLIRKCPDEPFPQICFCNVATRATYTYKVNGTTGIINQVPGDASNGNKATTLVSADKCQPDDIEENRYPIILSLLLPSEQMFATVSSSITKLLMGIVQVTNNASPPPVRPFRIYEVKTQLQLISNSLQATTNNQVQPFLTSLSMGQNLNASSTLVVFPNADAQLLEDEELKQYQSNDENILQTLPSIADCLHSLASYYFANSDQYSSVEAFATSTAEANLILKSLNTFQFNINITLSQNSSGWSSDIQSLLRTSSNPFVIVSAWNNTELIQEVVTARQNSSTGVLALAAHEGSLVRTTGYNSIIGDIFFVSYLDEWWLPTSSIGRYVSSTNTAYKYEGADPTVFMAAVTFGLSYVIAQQATAISSTASSVLYDLGSVTVGGITFGPYSNETCSQNQINQNSRDRDCQCYKGPRVFFVHSLLNMKEGTSSNRTGNFYYSISTCGIVYDSYVAPPQNSTGDNRMLGGMSPQESGISSKAIIGIAVGASAVVLIAVGAFAIIGCCCFGKMNRNAPTDSSKPFTIVFTDIQNSTGLWARAPEAMSASVEKHHSIIRSLISKHGGYEVKTIGDSFMIAFKSSQDAITLGLEIQTQFFKAKWSPEIDSNYMDLIAEAADENPKMNLILGTSREVYQQLWNGLRVRVGIHFGHGVIQKDSVSSGYDYYGTVVNTAARVEGVGHGGQILATEDTFTSLEPSYLNKILPQILDLGPQPLRGLDHHVRLRQINSVHFQKRQFPPLRLDVENAVGEGTCTDTTETVAGMDETLSPNVMAQRMSALNGKTDPEATLWGYFFFVAALSATPEKWRKEASKVFGKAWNVNVGHTPNGHMKGIMQIVMKVDSVARIKRAKVFETDSESVQNQTSKVEFSVNSRKKSGVPSDVQAFSEPSTPAEFNVMQPFESPTKQFDPLS